MTAILIAAVPVLIKLLLIGLIATGFVYHLKQHKQSAQLVWRTGNRWYINDQPGVAALRTVNFLSRWLVILSLQTETSAEKGIMRYFTDRQKFIIPADSLDKETFRLLRVRLRIEAQELLNPPPETIT